MKTPEKLNLAALPTPIKKLENLSKELGKNIWIKRDDLTGIECSGNKVRKLEYIFKHILDNSYDTVFTCGGKQSNHCRATASVATKLGIKCVLFLCGNDDGTRIGNLFLDELFGAEIKFVTDEEYENINDLMANEAKQLEAQGRKAYVMPLGGSNPLGAHGYVDSYKEIADFECNNSVYFDTICLSVGSGGTYAGLISGNKSNERKRQIAGINISATAEFFIEKIHDICQRMDTEHGGNFSVQKEDITIIDGYVGEGYGIASKEVIEFIKKLAKLEGIVLDPVYTGKAFHGLVSEIKKGRFDNCDNILFIHTGGIYGVFAQASEFGF